ncbi:hypothetical protein [Paraflavitalea pollutisoli]|uniref:hypothetical protein n=1 Tax=Paraflavitalea pollutisoli TaxID=3034143 RepID=UPI0023EB6416|nr:hypothetical protein [Paraflavitalea sp. H1-2-19X]
MTHCLHMRIDALLQASDADIEELTEQPAQTVRPELEKQKAAGDVYVPMAGCIGFHPVTGCPGHQSNEKEVRHEHTV